MPRDYHWREWATYIHSQRAQTEAIRILAEMIVNMRERNKEQIEIKELQDREPDWRI